MSAEYGGMRLPGYSCFWFIGGIEDAPYLRARAVGAVFGAAVAPAELQLPMLIRPCESEAPGTSNPGRRELLQSIARNDRQKTAPNGRRFCIAR
ncbi:hypothetical protein D3C81_2012130 [compost metagenome]